MRTVNAAVLVAVIALMGMNFASFGYQSRTFQDQQQFLDKYEEMYDAFGYCYQDLRMVVGIAQSESHRAERAEYELQRTRDRLTEVMSELKKYQ